jgi:hypothetical protein
MFKRALFFSLVTLAVVSLTPVAAQDETVRAADYVPADFAGFIEVRLDNPQATLSGMNIAAFAASQAQPTRVVLGTSGIPFDDFVPFSSLFDVDDTSFVANVLPWVNGEMVIAYRDFNSQLQAEAEDVLLIVPTESVLNAAGRLSAIIQQQDLLTPQSYRGVDVYQGDKTSIALTAPVVFIGPTDLIHAALDIQADLAEPMTANPVYGALRAASDSEAFVFAYVAGDHILPVVSGLVGGDEQSQPLLAAFGGALAQIRQDSGLETLLLNDGFDGAAASLKADIQDTQIIFTANAVFHSETASEPEAAADFDAALLDMIPLNAVLVQSGSDATGFLYNMLTALPMSNFARQMVGGLPIQTLGTQSELIALPDAQQVGDAVANYLDLLGEFGGVDLQADVIDHLSGSYVMAVLPRPNNPVPAINTPFDLLLTAHVNSDDALDGVVKVLQNVFDLQPMPDETIGDWDFARLGVANQAVFSVGVLDGTLMIATGDAAAQALAAGRGDNRLIDQTAWQTLSETVPPGLYVDRAAFINTFFPASGGAVPAADNRTQIGLYSDYQGSDIYALGIAVVIPTGG